MADFIRTVFWISACLSVGSALAIGKGPVTGAGIATLLLFLGLAVRAAMLVPIW